MDFLERACGLNTPDGRTRSLRERRKHPRWVVPVAATVPAAGGTGGGFRS